MATFRIQRDVIDVTGMPQCITIHKVTGKEIPSVRRGRYWCSDCDDWHDEYTFDKRFNPENFTQKYTGGFREFAPGLTHYFVDEVEVPKEDFERQYEAAHA